MYLFLVSFLLVGFGLRARILVFILPVGLGIEASRSMEVLELVAWVNSFYLVEIGTAGFVGLCTLLLVGRVSVKFVTFSFRCVGEGLFAIPMHLELRSDLGRCSSC